MKVSGIRKQRSAMGVGIRSGATDQFMRATGRVIRQMVGVDLFTPTVIFTMGIGAMTKRTGLGSIRTQMVLSMRVTGLTISNMAKVKKSGQMEHSTKVTIREARKMATVSSYGPISQVIQANFMKTISMDLESIAGPTVVFTTVNGHKIKCKGVVFLLGQMEGVMKVSITMIKKKVVADLSGLMDVVMMVTGGLVIKKGLVFIIMQRVRFVTAAGKMVKERNGYPRENFIKKQKDTNKIRDENSVSMKYNGIIKDNEHCERINMRSRNFRCIRWLLIMGFNNLLI